MISIERQQSLLLNIARKLEKKIKVYAIGGTAMMFQGLKEATLDIDLVFDNEKDKKIFKRSAGELGYKTFDPITIYGGRKDLPEMLKLDDERLDLFVNEVIDFTFSDSMKARAESTHQFGDTLILKIANPHDIILMKCATDRLKDRDDARKIIEIKKIDWNLIISEAENQVSLGRLNALFDLTCFFEELKYDLHLPIPQVIMDKLYQIVETQVHKKIRSPHRHIKSS